MDSPSLSCASGKTADAGKREHMFDKAVTPSDVGKLNRLVIPKQHAEKYFPLNAAAGEKGLLLSFEDRTGKWWRFRYSYWGSSQSYVITKGWSRFVKDKNLHAGDLVSFHRAAGDISLKTLFIDWRRRPPDHRHHYQGLFSVHRWWNSGVPSPFFLHRDLVIGAAASPVIRRGQIVGNAIYYNAGGYGGGCTCSAINRPNRWPVEGQGGAWPAGPSVNQSTAAKRVRLFGVNMECPSSDDDQDDSEVSTSTSSAPLSHTNNANFSDLHRFNHRILSHSNSGGNPNFWVTSNGKIQSATDVLHKGKPPMSLDLHI